MVAIKGHFDGKVIVPDGPVDLPKDRPLLLHVEVAEPRTEEPPPIIRRKGGWAKGQVWMSEDFDKPLDDFADYM